MPPLDADAWLAAVSEDSPAGDNLEFDPDFGALDRAAQGKPERQDGDAVTPAEDPDWKEVEALARGLLERTRDLRVLAHLAVARLHRAGLPDYVEMLSLLRQLIETRWQDIHPQLDPEDDNDPTLRANALLRLGDPGHVLKYLRDMPLANSARLGRYSWRDIAIATGALPSSDDNKPSETVIRSAFQDSDPARLAMIQQTAEDAAKQVAAVVAAFEAQAGVGTGPDLSELTKQLGQIAHTIGRYAVLSAPEEADSASEEAQPEAATDVTATTQAAPARPAVITAAAITEVTTRADAVRLLDLVSRYYQRYEPSSPLPLLIERARRLADKNFLDIIRDLAPDGLSQVQTVAGTHDE